MIRKDYWNGSEERYCNLLRANISVETNPFTIVTVLSAIAVEKGFGLTPPSPPQPQEIKSVDWENVIQKRIEYYILTGR